MTEDYFQQLCATVGEEKTKEHTELEAELQRLQVSDVTVMNQMGVLESGIHVQLPIHFISFLNVLPS